MTRTTATAIATTTTRTRTTTTTTPTVRRSKTVARATTRTIALRQLKGRLNTVSALVGSLEGPARPKLMLVATSAKMVVFVPLILPALKVLETELCSLHLVQLLLCLLLLLCVCHLVPRQLPHYHRLAPVQKAILEPSVNARLADLATAATVVLALSYHQVKPLLLETTMFAIAPHLSWKRLSVLDAIVTLLSPQIVLG